MKQHTIHLSANERRTIQTVTRKGMENARAIRRAAILLKSDRGKTDEVIADEVDVTVRTVERVRKRYATGGLKRALYDAPRPGASPLLNGTQEAHLIAIACSDPPEGHRRWTLELLKEALIKNHIVDSVSRGAIHLRLRERGIKPWREKNVVHSESNA